MLTSPKTIPTPREPRQPTIWRGKFNLDALDSGLAAHPPVRPEERPAAPSLPAQAPGQTGGLWSSGKFNLDSLGPLETPKPAPTPALPAISESYREAIRDAAKANNVPPDLLLRVLSEGSLPEGASLDSVNMRGLVKNGMASIYHTANLLSHILDKTGRNQAGYSKAFDEYNNEVQRRLSTDRFAPTTAGYLSQLHRAASQYPSPEAKYNHDMNTAYASDSHPEFPYPSKRPVPPEAAQGTNLLDLHRTLQGTIKFFDDIATGAIIDVLFAQTPTQPKIEATEQALKGLPGEALPALAHAEVEGSTRAIQDVAWAGRQFNALPIRGYRELKGIYDKYIVDLLGRTSAAGAKFVAGLTEGHGTAGSLKRGIHTFSHSESDKANQADIDRIESSLEEWLFQINVKAYEREIGHKPSARELETAGIEYDDPTKWGSVHKFVADFIVRTAVDPITYIPGGLVAKAFVGATHALQFLTLLRVGPKVIKTLGLYTDVLKAEGSVGEVIHRGMANVMAILGGAKDFKRLAELFEKTAPRLAYLADKATELETKAEEVAKTDPQRAAALLKRAQRHREAITRPYKSSKIAQEIETSKFVFTKFVNYFSSKWAAQVGLAKWGLLKNFDWLEPYGLAKRARAMSASEEAQLATWMSHRLDDVFNGLDLKGEDAKTLFKNLNDEKSTGIPGDDLLNRRYQLYRDTMNAIPWLYGDDWLREDLTQMGYEFPEALKNLDRGPLGLMTSPRAVEAARGDASISPEEAEAILKRSVYRPAYIPFKHLMKETMRLTPEEVEEVFLNQGYQAVTGVVVHTKDLRDEVTDFFLKDRPDLSIYAPEVHAAQSYARVKVAARVIATRHLAEDADNIARQFGIPTTDPSWADLFSETSKPVPVKGALAKGGPARYVQEQRMIVGKDASDPSVGARVKRLMDLPLVRMFYNPLGHMSNMANLALLNNPRLLPRIVQIYVKQLLPDIKLAYARTRLHDVKPGSPEEQRLQGLAKRFEHGRYQDRDLRKFTDYYATMGRYNGIKDFITAREYNLAKTVEDVGKVFEENLPILGSGILKFARGLATELRLSTMALWPFDEALKSALMEHYVEDLKMPLGRAYARVMAETVDYSDPSNFAQAARHLSWFATWRTKLPTVIFRLFMQNPRLFVILARLNPRMFGQTYSQRGERVEQLSPVVEAYRNPLGIPTSVPPLVQLIFGGGMEYLRGTNPFPDTPAQALLESLGLPPEIVRKMLKMKQYREKETWQDILFYEPVEKAYPAPSSSLQNYTLQQLLQAELGRHVQVRRNTMRFRFPR